MNTIVQKPLLSTVTQQLLNWIDTQESLAYLNITCVQSLLNCYVIFYFPCVIFHTSILGDEI